ncbi:SDR family oxidoreductase [Pseudomonas sp. LS1212]|uniref:SDR family oxidoreductase n=1 Tax=Pseudomonas sp. LS1212 TaxID=2972478 RepID=UPI00215C26B9|nr:SDR family oxidoreductase [Pseudomonas sp. LS1212]UVJ43949.1 SDR family oxidoreductase [Pseudomonas sp. LS1212]
MPAPTVLIAGCGDVGSRLARQLLEENWSVHGLRRTTARLPQGVIGVAGDLFAEQCPAAWPSGQIDYLVYCAAASSHDEEGYRAAYIDGLAHVFAWLKQHAQRPRRVLFVSSSSVYGQQQGEWIDETSATLPSGFSGRLMLEAERLAKGCGHAASVVRLTGIYGPGRESFMNNVRQGYRVAVEPPLYGNRIHVEDAAGLLAYLLQADARGEAMEDCYIGVDDDPAALADVVDWLRERMGVTQWSSEVSVRRTGSKRCSNARARALGWVPAYPTFREGYAAILEGK